MAPSWDEQSSDHKFVFFIEGLLNNRRPDTPMACRICDQVFTDNNSLIDHFQSHIDHNGTQAQSLVSPENGAKLFSSSTQSTDSFSVPMNANSVTNGGARNSYPPNPSNRLVIRDHPNPNLVPHTPKWKETTSSHRPSSYPYPSPSMIRSSMSQRTIASRSNFLLRKVNCPIGLVTPVTITQSTNFRLSQNAGTNGIARAMTTGSLVATVRQNEMEDASVYTQPFIMQLEQPIGKVVLGNNGVGGDSNPDDMDLTLKL